MSLLSILPIAAGVIAGAVVVSLALIHFLRSRAAETSAAPAAAGVQAISRKIDEALAEQRLQGETQRQLLAQKLDGVRESVENQRSHVDGLRGELRHEVQRRDAELQEIREQLGSIQRAVAAPQSAPAALPPASAPASAAAPSPFTPPPAAPTPAAPTPEPPALPFGAEPLDGAFEDVPLTSPSDSPPAAPFGDVGVSGDSFSEASFLDMAAPEPPPADPFATAPLRDPAPDAPAWAAETPPADASIFETAFFEEAPFAPPTGAPAPGDASAPTFADSTFQEASFGPPTFEQPSLEPPSFEEASFEEASFEEASFEEASFEEASFEAPSADVPAFEAPAFEAPEAVPARQPQAETSWVSRPNTSNGPNATAPVRASAEEFFGFPTAADDAPAAVPPPPAAATPTAPVEPTPEAPAPAEPAAGLVDLDAFAAPAPVAEPVPEPIEPPEGAEPLTVISTIDEDTQRLLYLAGVRTLEEIAQWGRGDARRISSKVDVSEETIMNQWVFEAQAALFRQYAQQAAG